MYLVFDTLEQAQTALDIVNETMGFCGNVTTVWAEIQQRIDGKYVFIVPPVEVEAIQEEYQEDWFPNITM